MSDRINRQRLTLFLFWLWTMTSERWQWFWRPHRVTSYVMMAISISYAFFPAQGGARFLEEQSAHIGLSLSAQQYALLIGLAAGALWQMDYNDNRLSYWFLTVPLAIHVLYMGLLFIADLTTPLPFIVYSVVWIGNGLQFHIRKFDAQIRIEHIELIFGHDGTNIKQAYIKALKSLSNGQST